MDDMEQRRVLNHLFGTRVVSNLQNRKPVIDLRDVLARFKERSMSEELLDPAHPEYYLNNDYKGWDPQPEVSEAYAATLPNTTEMMCDLRPVQDDKPVVLSKFHEELTGRPAPKGPQGIGDCVSWGNANGVNIHQCVEIKTGKAKYEYQEAMTESIYGLARCEVGKQWGSRKDGAVGAWAAKALTTYGCLSRANHGAYDPKRAKDWGANGLPDNLEPEAKLHIYKAAVMVTNFGQAAQLIQAGYPVVVCSNVGFTGTSKNSIGKRDSGGFCQARGTWYHCMVFIGVRFDREGLLCLQSWGPNVPEGPLDLDQPDNSFWVEAATSDRMLSQRDSYAYTDGFSGFKPNDHVLDWSF